MSQPDKEEIRRVLPYVEKIQSLEERLDYITIEVERIRQQYVSPLMFTHIHLVSGLNDALRELVSNVKNDQKEILG